VSQIDASKFNAGTAYVSVRKPLLDDLAPYIFRTHDFGKTWTKIVKGLGPTDYVHVVREDRKRKGLLYAGTQHGFWVSFDDGDSWRSLSLNLPDVPVSDAWPEDDSIAISTHGRSFYVLDNLGLLRQAAEADASANAHLFEPPDAIRGAGGATITYLLKKPAQKLTLEVLDGSGQVIFNAVGAPPPQRGGRGQAEQGGRGAAQGRGRGGPPAASLQPGVNRLNWNLTYPGATTFDGMILWGASTNGPAAVPGTYQVRLTVDGQQQTQPLVVRRHPLRPATDADLKEQFDLAIRIRDKVSEANQAVIDIRSVKEAVAARTAKSSDNRLKSAAETLTKNLTSVEEAIYQTKNESGQDPLNFPIRINNRIAGINRVVNSGDGKPISGVYEIFKEVTAELKVQTDRLAQVLGKDLAAFNAEAKRLGLEPVVVRR
jgi:hypothetical protein